MIGGLRREGPRPDGDASEFSQGAYCLLDVVFVVVEVDRQTQVALACGAGDAAVLESPEEVGGVAVTEWHGNDGAAVGDRDVHRGAADVDQRRPEKIGQFAIAASAASSPIAASQLIELSNRIAVDERFMVGPKKLSEGTCPAFQPVVTGTN